MKLSLEAIFPSTSMLTSSVISVNTFVLLMLPTRCQKKMITLKTVDSGESVTLKALALSRGPLAMWAHHQGATKVVALMR